MNKDLKSVLIIILLCSVGTHAYLLGQAGGLGSFQFLNLASSARSSALGSAVLSTQTGDVGLALQNPTLYDSASHNQLSWNHTFHLVGISHGSVSFGQHLSAKKISLGVGVQYIDYGDFSRTDEFGNLQGSFGGREVGLRLSINKHVQDRLSFGMSLITANATFDTYGAWGLGATFAARYSMPQSNSTVSIVLQNIGSMISHFSRREPWQTSLVVSFSKRLRHVPLRYYLTFDQLERWDIRTKRLDGSIVSVNNTLDEVSGVSRFIDNFFRHVVIGGELSLGQREMVQLRFSYNHRQARELGLTDFRSLSGFALGFGIKTGLMSFDYAVNRYHLAGSNHQLGVILYTNRLFSKL